MERVAIIGGCRTPFVNAGGDYRSASFHDLGVHVVRETIKRCNLDPAEVEELIFSTVLLDPRTPNAAREIVLRSGLPKTISAHFISNNCISGLVALNFLSDAIRCGRVSLGIGGGSESMSRPALTLRPEAEALFIELSGARTFGARVNVVKNFRPQHFFPLPPSPKEPSTGLTMGEHCEITAKEFSIDRQSQDAWALRSHQQAAEAQSQGYLADEIAPFLGVDRDGIIRSDTSIEKLGKLRPVFDRSDRGTLTAGNSSPLTDGASAVALMSESRAIKEEREILGFIESVEFAAIDPNDGLLMAPATAVPTLLRKNNLQVADIDLFEIHEAFAAQVLANRKAWSTGWEKYPAASSIGDIPDEKINRNGGSIAIGHPFAATGGRLVLSLARELHRSGGELGVISVCAAGAMAGAILIRRV